MIIYCEICGKDFNKKYYYDRHKNRKNPCKPKKIEQNIHQNFGGIPLQNPSNFLQNPSNFLQHPSNFLHGQNPLLHSSHPLYHNQANFINYASEIPHNCTLNQEEKTINQKRGDVIEEKMEGVKEEKMEGVKEEKMEGVKDDVMNVKEKKGKKKKIFTCEFCEKTFSRNDNLQRHLKNRCKSRNDEETEIEKLKRKIEELSKTNENLEKRSTSTININNNIQLNPFGKENLEYIKEELLKNAIKVPHFGLPNLIRLIHFNKDHPENMNVKQRNKKKPMVDVYNGKEWITMDKNDTIHNMVASKKELMDNYFDKFQELDDYSKNNYERFSYSVDSYLKSQLPKTDCFETIEVTNKCKELYKSFIYKIDILLVNREVCNQNQNMI